MSATSEFPDYSRQVVKASPIPDWATLQQSARAWVWLNGALSQTLQDELKQLDRFFNGRWLWYGTPWAFTPPGYRSGPLLVTLDESIFNHALAHWLPQQIGLIVLAPDDEDSLVAHLEHLQQLTGANGQALSFGLGAFRALEELCEALPAERLAQLLGPIQRLVWYAGDQHSGEWVSVDAPVTGAAPTIAQRPFELSTYEEAALNPATQAWFMRDCAREFRRRFPVYDAADAQAELWRRLNAFALEASALTLRTERDVRHFMELRLRYPQRFFDHDRVLREIMLRRAVEGKQRLIDAEARLAQLAAQDVTGETP
ncbi:DUF4123 domain-containing protein [Pseudomonas cremoricolorata]|uniref:DUF4123 domain-containing protein n=1 Tax=Pseudomonas cremoricolorata TaxID=157783 RepID=A0A089WJG2_9PSED|nr:DUF4123 domain-containing protein [Pseudomonas cremoricolorata]AIR89455.1 hypothetical protein LK03_09260 [Pseudomonas cremoricolorata]